MALPGPGPELRPCSCKNSRCLKLYCICFDAGAFCDAGLCHCKNCANLPSNTDEVMQARMNILAKNPAAFQPKVVARGEAVAAHKGCNCRRTRCLKKYCDCFSVGAHCQPNICSCIECANMPSAPPPGAPVLWGGAGAAQLEYAAAQQYIGLGQQYIPGQFTVQPAQLPSATKALNQQHYQAGTEQYDAAGHNTTPTPRFEAPGKASGGQAGYLHTGGVAGGGAGGSGGDGQATVDMGDQAVLSPEGTTGAVQMARIASPGPKGARASVTPAGPAGVVARLSDSAAGLQLPPLKAQGHFSVPGQMEGGDRMARARRLSQTGGEGGWTREGLTQSDPGSHIPGGVGSASAISAPVSGAGGVHAGMGTHGSWPGSQPAVPGLLGEAAPQEQLPVAHRPGAQPQGSHVSPAHNPPQQQQVPSGLEDLPYMPGAHAINVRPPAHAIQHGGISGDLGGAPELWDAAAGSRMPGETPHPLEALSPPSTRALIGSDGHSLNPGATLPLEPGLLSNNGASGHQGALGAQGGGMPAHQAQAVVPAGAQVVQQAGGQMVAVQGAQSAPARAGVSRMVNVDNGPYSAGYASAPSYAPASVDMVQSAPVYMSPEGPVDDWEYNDGQRQYYTWQPSSHQHLVSELLSSHSLTQLAALRLLRSSRVQQLLSDTVTHPAAMEDRGSAHHTLRVGPSIQATLEECQGLCVLMCACAAPPTLAEGGATAPARLGKAAAGAWNAQEVGQVLVGRAMLSTQLTHSLTGMVTLQACLLVVSESSAHPFARELAVNLLGRMAYLHRLLPMSLFESQAVMTALNIAMSSEEPLGLRFAALCFAACAPESAMEHLDMDFTAVLHDVRQAVASQPGGAASLVVYPASGGTALAMLNMGVQVNASARLLFRTWPTFKAMATEVPWAVPYQLMDQLPSTLHADILASLQRKHTCQIQWATHNEVAGVNGTQGSAWPQPGSGGPTHPRSAARQQQQHGSAPAAAAAGSNAPAVKSEWREETPELILGGGGMDPMGMSDQGGVTPTGLTAHGSAPAGLPGLIGNEGMAGEDAVGMVPEPLPLAHGMLGAGAAGDMGADADDALVITTAPGSHANVMNSPRLLMMRHPSLGQGPSPAKHPFSLDPHHGGSNAGDLLLLAGSPRHLGAMSPRQIQISRIYPALTPTKGQQVTPTRAPGLHQANAQHPFALRGGMRGPSSSPLASLPPSAALAPFNNSLHIPPGQAAQAPGAVLQQQQQQQQQASPQGGNNAHPQARSLRDLLHRPRGQPGSGQQQGGLQEQGQTSNLLQQPRASENLLAQQSSLDPMQQERLQGLQSDQHQQAQQGRGGSPWGAGALKRNMPDNSSEPSAPLQGNIHAKLSSPPYQQQQQQGGRTSPNKLPRTTSQNCAVHMGLPGSGVQLRAPALQQQAMPPPQHQQQLPQQQALEQRHQPGQHHNILSQPVAQSSQAQLSMFAQPGQQLMVMHSHGIHQNGSSGAWLPPHVASAAAEMAAFTSQWDAQSLMQGQLQGYPMQGGAQQPHPQQLYQHMAGFAPGLPSHPEQVQMLFQQQVPQGMLGQGQGFSSMQ